MSEWNTYRVAGTNVRPGLSCHIYNRLQLVDNFYQALFQQFLFGLNKPTLLTRQSQCLYSHATTVMRNISRFQSNTLHLQILKEWT